MDINDINIRLDDNDSVTLSREEWLEISSKNRINEIRNEEIDDIIDKANTLSANLREILSRFEDSVSGACDKGEESAIRLARQALDDWSV